MLPLPPEYIAVGTGTPLTFGVETWSCMPVDPGPRGIFFSFKFYNEFHFSLNFLNVNLFFPLFPQNVYIYIHKCTYVRTYTKASTSSYSCAIDIAILARSIAIAN